MPQRHLGAVVQEKIGIFARAVTGFELNLEREIKQSETLMVFMHWAFFSFVVSFSGWINNGYTGQYSPLPCWPHFTDCKDILPLTPLPYGYSETIFYAVLLSVITYGLYNLYYKKYITAYYCLLILWAWKVFVVNVTYGIGNFDYYDLVLIGVFLFLRDKRNSLRLFFVLLYFLASTIKIAPGWIDGAYFTSMQTGLPLFSDTLAPFVTNAVVLFQIVGAWFLLSKNKYLYNFSLVFFIFFHLYSTILVGYRYPLTALFCLIVLFGLEKEHTFFRDIKFSGRGILNFIVILFLFALQFVGLIIPGNQKITLEGNYYGLYMFEANHQCVSSHTISTKDGKEITQTFSSADARNRCDPYIHLWRLKKKCTGETAQIAWTFDHSINGEPLYRIVDVANACTTIYRPFAHNQWINVANPHYIANVNKDGYDLGRGSQGQGVFEKNIDGVIYRGNSSIENNQIAQKTYIQKIITDYSDVIIAAYWTLWATVLVVVCVNIAA